MIFTLIRFLISLLRKKPFSYNRDFRLALFTLIVFYIQVVLGIFNYFGSHYFEGLKNGKFAEYMKVAHDRQAVMEHPVMMLIVLMLMHYGFNRMKKNTNSAKQQMAIIIFYGIGFLLVLIRIPWQTWLN
jgi:hypothetical protein